MKANKKTLMAVKYFIENEQEYWDKDGVISEIIEETKMLRHKDIGQLEADECGVEWDGENICNLDDFVRTFLDRMIEKFSNILESFVGEDISCYFEEE